MKGRTMREAFIEWNPTKDVTKALLAHAVRVADEYMAEGYQLTLRQLYYQLVARDIIPNAQSWYKRLGDVVTKARMSGWLDWDAIVDRGRTPVMPSQWDSPTHILNVAADSYRTDRWQGQETYVEVWVEKDALMGILEPVCEREHVRALACRGYASATAIYDSAKRLGDAAERGQEPHVLYLGDHDPSGLDMTRDIRDRLSTMLAYFDVQVDRLAPNMDQVIEHAPPPNPTKLSDSRAKRYIASYGDDSWELDALDPATLTQVVDEAILNLRDAELWDAMLDEEEKERAQIRKAAAALRTGK